MKTHYVQIADRNKSSTVKHFREERIPRPTIYRIIKKFEDTGIVHDKPICGRPKKLSNTQLEEIPKRAVRLCLTDLG